MSYKHLNEVVIISGDGYGTDTVLSDISDVTYLDTISYQVNILAGDMNGTFTILASNDYDPVKNEGTFVPTAVTLAATSGSFAGSQPSGFLNIVNWSLPYKYVRLRYVNTSGTGEFDAVLNGKGI